MTMINPQLNKAPNKCFMVDLQRQVHCCDYFTFHNFSAIPYINMFVIKYYINILLIIQH